MDKLKDLPKAVTPEDIQRRKEELVKELSLLLLPLRHDSRLCSSYIYGQLGDDWDVHRVVHECATMHWLYSYTLYQQRVREAYMYFSTILTSGRSVHEFIKHNVQPHIKATTILQHGGIPLRWPWLPSEEVSQLSQVSPEESKAHEVSQVSQVDSKDWLVVSDSTS